MGHWVKSWAFLWQLEDKGALYIYSSPDVWLWKTHCFTAKQFKEHAHKNGVEHLSTRILQLWFIKGHAYPHILSSSPSYSVENNSATTCPEYFKAYRKNKKPQFLSISRFWVCLSHAETFSYQYPGVMHHTDKGNATGDALPETKAE